MILCFFLPITKEVNPEPVEAKGDFLTEFEAAFKYSIDNLDALSNSTVPEIVDESIRAAGQKGTVTILTVNEVKESLEQSKSNVPLANCLLTLIGDVTGAGSSAEILFAIARYTLCLERLGYASDSPEMQFAMQYQQTMELIINELQYYKKGMTEEDMDFVPEWVICAAGIIGGAGAGGISGATSGLFGGPGGAAWGGFIGAVAGGFTGAAKFC